MKDAIVKKLQGIVNKLTKEEVKIELSIPKDINNGDFTTNISFQLAKLLHKSPLDSAHEVVKEFGNLAGIEKVEAIAPGFINFHLSVKSLSNNIETLLKTPEKVITSGEMKGMKVIIEFTDPNPFKEFHIGHVYTNTVGEAMSRLYEANGAEVQRADYFGDVGMHIAKSLFGLEKKFAEDNLSIADLTKKSLNERIEYFGQAYAKGSSIYEENESAQKEMKLLNKLIYISAQKMWKKEKGIVSHVDYRQGEPIDEARLAQVYELYTIGRQWSLDYFESIYKRLGMQFGGYYPESIAGEKGYQLVKEHLADKTFVEHDGAVIFPGEEYGLHTRVFINSLGLPTYEAKELGLAVWKNEEFPYDFSIILTGSEINEYFKVLMKALSLIKPDLAAKTKHIGHGMVKLATGKKMSSRSGQIIAGVDVLNEAKILAKKKITEAKLKSEIVDSKQSDFIAEQVGIGAIKYSFLKSSIGKDVPFSFEESVSFEGNAGPYMQYAYTRTKSLLYKAESIGLKPQLSSDYSILEDEKKLMQKLVQFAEIVEDAAKNYAPNMVCEYLFELAQMFNNFYQKFRILNAASQSEKEFRLWLTAGVGLILKQGLALLGIQAPEKM